MENEQVKTAETINAGEVETAETVNKAGAEKNFKWTAEQQAEINKLIQERIIRDRKAREKENNVPKKEVTQERVDKVPLSEVKSLQLKIADYEKKLALSKYDIDDSFRAFVEYSVLRNVSKDKNYEQAVEEFFADENNKRYLRGGKTLNMPRPQNIGTPQDPILSKYGDVKPLNKGRI
jgi:hypothetical protein